MEINKKELEDKMDEMLITMYKSITHSDLNGNVVNDYNISLLFALRCVDVNRPRYNVVSKTDMIKLARRIVEIYEYSPMIFMDYISMEEWAEALLIYMKNNKLRYKHICNISNSELINELKTYIERKMFGEYIS